MRGSVDVMGGPHRLLPSSQPSCATDFPLKPASSRPEPAVIAPVLLVGGDSPPVRRLDATAPDLASAGRVR